MEADVSLPHLQVLATVPIPFPNENKKKCVFLSVVLLAWVNTIQTQTRTANLKSEPVRCKIIPQQNTYCIRITRNINLNTVFPSPNWTDMLFSQVIYKWLSAQPSFPWLLTLKCYSTNVTFLCSQVT